MPYYTVSVLVTDSVRVKAASEEEARNTLSAAYKAEEVEFTWGELQVSDVQPSDGAEFQVIDGKWEPLYEE